MEIEAVTTLLNKLDASSLILVLFAYGVYKLGNKMIDTFSVHGEKLNTHVDSIRGDIHELKNSMGTIASQVSTHEYRITNLEKKD